MEQNNYKLDGRSLEDIRKELQKLSESYVPEWNFNQEDPDIGSVLAMLFADQLHYNVERFNQALDRYHTEFVNLLDISLRPAHPACATVLMNLVSDTVSSIPVEQGTKLLAEEEGEKLVFETAFPVCLSGSRLDAAFMTSGKKGTVLPVFGHFQEKDYTGESPRGEELSETGLRPFDLFEFDRPGLERQAMVLYHSGIFDVENETIYCRLSGNPEFLNRFEAGEFRFLYYTDEGFLPVEETKVLGDQILLIKKKANKKVTVKGRVYSMFVLEATKPQKESINFESVAFSSAGGVRRADYVGNGSTDYEVEQFDLFGDALSLFSECYIGMDNYFAKAGSRITLGFHTEFGERLVGPVRQQEEGNLKIIKRKPRGTVESALSYTCAEEISIEYYNGIGWKRLECEKEYRKMFASCEGGNYELSFFCPDDWEPVSAGAYHGRTLRIQLLRADNCYYQPCIHRYPKISDLMVSYTYEDKFEKPELAKMFYGTKESDLTRALQENRPFTGFTGGNYKDTALYLGFNQIFEKGPVSLWWKLADEDRNQNRKLRCYYSTGNGFKEMKVVDYTENLTRSGIMLFLPAADMALYEMEGKQLCWLKFTAEEDGGETGGGRISQIALNAVEVRNIETLPEEDFYLDSTGSELTFPLKADGILDADVWVNEFGTLSEDTMRGMLREMPDRVRAEYNYLGDIEEFFVKWEERDNFAASGPASRHYLLDRMQGRLIFGDGVHVKTPKNLDGTAFTVQVRRCRGQKGNVPAYAISESNTNLLYVQDIFNPEPAFGGTDMETLDRALERGAGLLSSGGRFVTEEDYIREVCSFSKNIDKAAVVTGINRDGGVQEGVLHVVLLMRDFADGAGSFYRMQKELKDHLFTHCELAIGPEELLIEEPVFVELSVDVWAQVMQLSDSFEIQTLVEDTLRAYLNPVSDDRHRGWDIGTLPRKAQIIMRLNALKSRAIMRQVLVTARYTDDTGTHEVDLDDMRATPFLVVKNGEHRVHITMEEQDMR